MVRTSLGGPAASGFAADAVMSLLLLFYDYCSLGLIDGGWHGDDGTTVAVLGIAEDCGIATH